MSIPPSHRERERHEFQLIRQWFPQARIKEDYNREILDIGVEIPVDDTVFILLKGDQTNHLYELITPDCKCIEGLSGLREVYTEIQRICRDSS